MIKFDRENFTLNINAADVNTLIVALLEHKEKASTLKGSPGGSGFMIQVAVDGMGPQTKFATVSVAVLSPK